MTAPLIAFDTATDRLCVALVASGRVWTHDGDASERASAQLLPVIDRMLGQAGLRLPEVAAIGYGRGPGAFTGLRAACAVAQGLAMVGGQPVIGLDTLMAVAEDAAERAGPAPAPSAPPSPAHAASLRPALDDWWVLQDARMGEIYAARYRPDPSAPAGWAVLQPPGLWTPERWNALQAADPSRGVAGSALSAFGERLRIAGAQAVGDARPTARALAQLMQRAHAQGLGGPAAQALPLYVRDKVAETTAEREARRAAPAAVVA